MISRNQVKKEEPKIKLAGSGKTLWRRFYLDHLGMTEGNAVPFGKKEDREKMAHKTGVFGEYTRREDKGKISVNRHREKTSKKENYLSLSRLCWKSKRNKQKFFLKMQIQICFLHGEILRHCLGNSKLRTNTKHGHEQLVVRGHLDNSQTQVQRTVMGKISLTYKI